MKVALIPPRGLENYALRSNFHLALALPSLMERRTYRGMYERAVRLGDYVVLDNGAHEGALASNDALTDLSQKIGCSELVLPDVICEPRSTVEVVSRFLTDDRLQVPGSLMAVAQGTGWKHFTHCVNAFADMPDIRVIGIPRHMIPTLDKKPARIELANWIAEKHPDRFEIHFLGMHPMWLGEIAATVKYAPHVRSVDSSLPFNYALVGKTLTSKDIIMRPSAYFEEDWSRRVSTKLIRSNIMTLMEWAGADVREETPGSEMRSVPTLQREFLRSLGST